MFRDDMSVSVYMVHPPSQIPDLVTALGIQYFSSSCYKNKLTCTISYNNKALVKFYRMIFHDAPNGHFPGINFLKFLVHGSFNNKPSYIAI